MKLLVTADEQGNIVSTAPALPRATPSPEPRASLFGWLIRLFGGKSSRASDASTVVSAVVEPEPGRTVYEVELPAELRERPLSEIHARYRLDSHGDGARLVKQR